MRILFLTQWFDPEPGALRGLPLARWLVQRGHEVEVVTGFPNYPSGKIYPGYRMRLWQRQEMDGVSVLRVPLYPNHDESAVRRIVNYGSFALSAASLGTSLIGKADVGFVYHPPATVGFPAMVLKRLRSVPFIYHIADMWPESVVESGMIGNGKKRRAVESLLSKWCKMVYRDARAITVLSPGFKQLLIERGVPADKIHIIYNWADDVFEPMPKDEALAEELGLKGYFNIVYAGNMGAFQGLETVINAASRLKHIPEIQFVLIGTGQKEDELKTLAQERGLSNVRFLGRRQFWEMPKINSLADVLLVHLKDFPFFSSTIPSKTQVSLASGRPVLMAVRGDAADVINRAGAGLACQPESEEELAEAVLKLFKMERSQLESMGARGREFYLNEMSLEIGGAHMETLLREVSGHRANGNGR
ncbi:MAG TPA: glycosyltransferase family 4 protein [Pyrinomonadaceae bacterium]|nr:glycosyltransferase family 4 protein [Pyrinomonadaceae bacterium]